MYSLFYWVFSVNLLLGTTDLLINIHMLNLYCRENVYYVAEDVQFTAHI